MTDPTGAMPAATPDPAMGTDSNDDVLAQQLLADAVSATDAPKDIPAGDKRAILADLAKEREKRKAIEDRFARLAAALGDGDAAKGKSDIELLNERFDTYERQLTTERAERFRAEVAHEKGFTPEQAALLSGTTREELAAAADRLLTLFPTAPAKPGIPAPDPSQGSRGGIGIDLDARIAEAQKAGDWRRVISLQNEKLTNAK